MGEDWETFSQRLSRRQATPVVVDAAVSAKKRSIDRQLRSLYLIHHQELAAVNDGRQEFSDGGVHWQRLTHRAPGALASHH